ncbi:UDP-N-acetylmuramoyl-tripeptide--D-alanyl-D-alanine ligase [uncultured Eubacterium sp.]|uniref:UDP-N-acetylmuramoyl-tripeptide--D-alanyl-D- alanine ligase n=1 Tax=uncultured Eubacterium sp. TaxID=165185 RepID=UPI0025D5709E|nr:UDP-N-acetylmuramoyl-tripeptide--D-alanyl-D-alanine ligase [uncultured Eubacterium sp.]MCI6537683.1 UDP-N-acetylmuramoyl-tripeptide--D-alanyl-D-alanine ligase [Lachnospiraceae bacterium]
MNNHTLQQMTLENIAKACGGTYVGEDALRGSEITGAVIDSRQVKPGYLYIPIRGERVDGHRFIPDVFEKGALAVLSEEPLENPAGPYIQVASSEQALKDIAEFYRSTLSIKIIGITGSVGKTSTKEMISAVLGQKYNVLKTEGNFNNEIGLPLTILRIRREHEVAVVEMGISEFGEMHRIAKVAKPDICVMTNIGQCHLENLIDRDGVLRAKSEIFDFLKPDGHIVLNGNDDKLITVSEVHGVKPVFYHVEDGTAPAAEIAYEVTADGIENKGLRGLDAVLHFPEETCEIHEPIPGVHNVYNACAAACVGRIMGLTNEEICEGIRHAKTIAGRTNLITMGELLVIDDCYNANPVSMKASLDVLSQADGRKIAVLGDMGELGENERELHYEVGKYAANKGVDILFCCGTLSEELAKGAQRGHTQVMYFKTLDKMMLALIPYLKSGDTVLVKASHFMEFPKVVEAIRKAWEE